MKNGSIAVLWKQRHKLLTFSFVCLSSGRSSLWTPGTRSTRQWISIESPITNSSADDRLIFRQCFLFSKTARPHFRLPVFWKRGPFICSRTALVRSGGRGRPCSGRLMCLSYGPRMTVDMRASNDTSPTLRSWSHSSTSERWPSGRRRQRPSAPAILDAQYCCVLYMTTTAASLDVCRDLHSKPTLSLNRTEHRSSPATFSIQPGIDKHILNIIIYSCIHQMAAHTYKNKYFSCLFYVYNMAVRVCSARQHMLSALLCYRPSVRHTGASVETRKRLKLESCNFHHTVPSSVCGISFIQKFRRDPPERGRQTRVGWETSCMLSVF